jgi:hypothetical protein
LNVHFTRAVIPSQFIGTVKPVHHVSLTVARRNAASPLNEAKRNIDARLLLKHYVLKLWETRTLLER